MFSMAHTRTLLASNGYMENGLSNTSSVCMRPRIETGCVRGCSGANLLRGREAAGLKLAEAVYSSGLRLPTHSHEHAHFCLLLQGTYEERSGTHHLVRKPGSLAFVAGGSKHSNQIHPYGIR